MSVRRALLGGSGFAEAEVLRLSRVAEAGRVMGTDKRMHPTAICNNAACGHVRWRHGPYPRNPCNVPNCPCIRGWDFDEVVFVGNRHTDGKLSDD